MLTPPALSADTITSCLRESYGLRIRQATFLPLGADVNAAVYRVDAEDGTPYFLKVKGRDFAEVAVAVPAFLHAQCVRQVMAPLPTVMHQLWASGHGFEWILYPFFEGRNGYEAALSDAQWVALGQSLKAVHTTILPPALGRLVPREDYASRWRDIVEEYDQQVETRVYDDPIAESLAAFWITKRDEIRAMVARAGELSRALRQRDDAFVLCHTDLHAWNVLVGANGELAIVDWDATILAPKERDLMFVGGGVGAVWDTAREEALFYQGYGATQIDPLALSYYRYERIVADLAAYGAQIFEVQGSVEDRDEGLKQLRAQFLPNHVAAIAHRTYQQLPSSLAP
jgi:spectinomycin phosphotransferase